MGHDLLTLVYWEMLRKVVRRWGGKPLADTFISEGLSFGPHSACSRCSV